MEKLYYENPYMREFTAEILNILEKDGSYHIELDKTCFYPRDEYYMGDRGFINTVPVVDVYERDGTIYHVVGVKPLKIHRVKCSIDWEKRFDYMQHHLGQHILSGCFTELFNANTVKFSFGEGHFSISIDRIVGEEEIGKAEALANEIIHENIAVETLQPTNAELKKMEIKKNHSGTTEIIRIIKVEDIVLTQCDMIHPNSTIEVQLIKIVKWSKNEKSTKIEFMCGSRAVSDYLSTFNSMEKMSKALHCSKDNLLGEFERLSNELKKVESEKRSLKSEVAEYEIQNMLNSSELIKDVRVIKSIFNNEDSKYINLLATRLSSNPKVVVLFAIVSEDKAQLIFMRSKELNIISMNSLLKDAITLIDGKGGGSDFSAQGGGKNNNNLDSTIEYAYKRVKDSIMSK